ncbi:hypothetical protein ACOSP7_028559 [Xanthoceras sorbifolium]|uniref:Uncharacterized protein n=1 Tax=Xanthoceras sorbifolium TaxID=99658 RepID=A0ABQ8HCU2_9ROSI|nr:hypothetical protein JRO89_XS12G0156700 [Xanthoceras sorbifolium]
MVSPSHLRALHPLQVFSIKSPPSSSSTLSYMKIKTLIQTFIFSHLYRVIRALSKAKSILIQILREYVQPNIHFISPTKITRKNKAKKKIFFGSFRLHYNWCSSHVMPVPAPVLDGLTATHLYYDSTWNSVISTENFEEDDNGESQLSGYLHWLEEKVRDNNNNNNNNSATEQQPNANEIDKLADIFIANCHEKFRLEKQESYRRFQEMLARSM